MSRKYWRYCNGSSTLRFISLLGSKYNQLSAFQLKSNTAPLETSDSSESEKPVVEKFNFQWKEIGRIMNTQKSVLTVSQNRYDQIVISRRCSDPSPKVQAIYNRLHDKQKLYIKRKSVVHKMDFEKIDIFDLQDFCYDILQHGLNVFVKLN